MTTTETVRKPWVRMRTIFGESVLPPESAAIVVRAVNRAVAVGDVSRNARWQFVEWMAAEYLHEDRQLRNAQRGQPTDPRPVVSAVSPAAMAERMQALVDEWRYPDSARFDDLEQWYGEADALMVEVLRSLGYEEAMDIFAEMSA